MNDTVNILTDIKELDNGLYKVYWKGEAKGYGNYSLVAIGRNHEGRIWFAPTNWVNTYNNYLDEHIDAIVNMELIQK